MSMTRKMHQSPPKLRVPRTITTNDVQWYLDENKRLIMAIFENMKLRKFDNCAQYQEQLQKNLMYLAALADWQHSQTQVRTQELQQMNVPSRMQPEHCMQHPQFVPIAQQLRISPSNMALQFANAQEQLHQQVALRAGWIGNGKNPMYDGECGFGGGKSGGSTSTATPNDACGGSLQGPSDGGDGHGNNSVALHNHNNIASSHLQD